jgi:hypothetical protein
VWRRTYALRESEIVRVLTEALERFPRVLVGSYPRFAPEGPEVEVVLKCGDPAAVAAASEWIAAELDSIVGSRAG